MEARARAPRTHIIVYIVELLLLLIRERTSTGKYCFVCELITFKSRIRHIYTRGACIRIRIGEKALFSFCPPRLCRSSCRTGISRLLSLSPGSRILCQRILMSQARCSSGRCMIAKTLIVRILSKWSVRIWQWTQCIVSGCCVLAHIVHFDVCLGFGG